MNHNVITDEGSDFRFGIMPSLFEVITPDFKGENWPANDKRWETVHANRLNAHFIGSNYEISPRNNQKGWDLYDKNGKNPLVQAKTVTGAYSFGGSNTLWQRLTKPLLDESSDGEGYLSFLLLDKRFNVIKHFIGSVHLIPRLNARGRPQQNITPTQPPKWGFAEVTCHMV